MAQNQIIWRPELAHEWKTITMSWQVEQLKEELSSKDAQGEELKKRAAGLQSEVFAVRFTSLCAVVPQWDAAGSGFWVAYTFTLWMAALPILSTNQPALLLTDICSQFDPLVTCAHWDCMYSGALHPVLSCFATLWMVSQNSSSSSSCWLDIHWLTWMLFPSILFRYRNV